MNHGFSGTDRGGSRAFLRHSTSFAEHHRQDQLHLSVHSNVSLEDIDRSIDRALSNKHVSLHSKGHSFVSTVKGDAVQSAVPKFSAHKNAPNKGSKQSVKLSRDLLELLSSKKVLDPLTVEPGSDISVSDVASVLDLEALSTNMIVIPKPEEPNEVLVQGISDTLEDLDCDEDETTSMNVSLPGMVVSQTPGIQVKPSKLDEYETGRIIEAFGPSPRSVQPNVKNELDDSIETFGSNNGDDSSELCASFAEESSGEYAPMRLSERSCRSAFSSRSRRNSFASTGSALESISEVAVFEEELGNVPCMFGTANSNFGESVRLDLDMMKNIVSLDQVNHHSSFTLGSSIASSDSKSDGKETNEDLCPFNEALLDIIQKDCSGQNDESGDDIDDEDLEFYAQLFAESLDQQESQDSAKPPIVGREYSYGSVQSYGSAVSTSKLHRDSFVVHTEALEGHCGFEDPSASTEPAFALVDEDLTFHETLMDIIDDGGIEEQLEDDHLDDHDLDLYAQALADNLKAEHVLQADCKNVDMTRGHVRTKSSISCTGSVTSGMRKDSFAKHMLSMDGNDGDHISTRHSIQPPRRSSSGNLSIRSGFSGATDLGFSEGSKRSPNRPHPALENPMFYWWLRQFPWLFEKVKVAYAYRWKLSYPLQRRPFGGCMEKYNIFVNWGELLLLLPFFVAAIAGVLYSFVIPSVAVSGRVARYGLIAALVLAQRNSMITFAIGMPFDRAIMYHKLAGRLAGVAGITHTICFFLDPKFRETHRADFLGGTFTGAMNISGTMIMILMLGIVLSSLDRVRRYMFEVFYYLHIVFVVGMAVSAFFHSGILVPILAALIWGVDLVIRSVIMARIRYPRRATLEIVSETVVKLSFPKTSNFAYNPGQYVYIAVPEISWLEWHPFSISSSPKQLSVTCHIRKAGSFTSALYKLAQKQKEVSVLMEGPYGNLAVDILSDRKYKRIMLISGGIGLTPMQSICDQLLYERAKNRRELNSLQFIWIERDPVLMQEHEFIRRTSSIGSLGSLDLDDYLSSDGSIKLVDDDLPASPRVNVFLGDSGVVNGQLEQLAHRDHSTNIASQLLSLLPPDRTTDAELEELYASQNRLNWNDDDDDGSRTLPYAVETSVEINNNHNKDDETSFADNSASWGMESSHRLQEDLANVLNMKVYLTSKTTANGPMMVPFAQQGRPDIPKLFEAEIKNSKRGEKIAVLVSAPPKLMEVVQKACIRHSRNKRNIRFDYHSEYLGM